ncbi:MAG TPA: putative lipid II flippase FtsW [bacterium]|nr:putative lipid II flippase FtsW [bacterium]
MNKSFEKIDFTLFTAVFAAVLLGLLTVYSSSAVFAYEEFGDGAHYFKRQIMWALLGAVGAVFLFKLGPEKMRRYALPMLVMSVILLFAVHVPGFGRKAGGAVRWLKMGPFSFQPFEFVKFFYVFYLAAVLSADKQGIIKKGGQIILMTLLVSVGLILQRDFGGMAIITMLLLVMLFVSGIPIYVFGGLAAAAAGVFAFLIKIEPYRLKRVLSFLNPWDDYYGAGWQTIQSLIAIGSGGPLGVGFTQSQQKFYYLPAPHTDYIYSIIGEEWGLIGALAVLAVFYVILQRGVYIALHTEDRFLKFTAYGMTFMIVVQALINMFVAAGLLPPKGTTLPFLSSGGSSLIVNLAAIALLLSISRKLKGDRA